MNWEDPEWLERIDRMRPKAYPVVAVVVLLVLIWVIVRGY